jgi:hypothetical protein
MLQVQQYPSIVQYPAYPAPSCCCSAKCALINAATWSGIFLILGLTTVGLGFTWGPSGGGQMTVAFASIAPGMVLLFPQIVLVGVAGALAGCYRYKCTDCCCRRDRRCFFDRPHGRVGIQLLTAFYFFGVVSFVMLANTWVCLYGVGGYCGATSLVVMLTHCLGFSSIIKFLHDARQQTPHAQPAVPAGVQLQSVVHHHHQQQQQQQQQPVYPAQPVYPVQQQPIYAAAVAMQVRDGLCVGVCKLLPECACMRACMRACLRACVRRVCKWFLVDAGRAPTIRAHGSD